MLTIPAKTVTGRVIGLKRAGTSVNGNPSYSVTLEVSAIDGTPAQSSTPVTVRTMSDAMLAYGIGNAEYRDFEHVYTLTRAGRIRTATRVELEVKA